MINWRRSWFPVRYAICPTKADWRKAMKKAKYAKTCDVSYPDSAGCTMVYTNQQLERCALVVVNVDWKENPALAIGVLVHECVHVVEAIIDKMQDGSPSEEFRAYATQAIFQELFDDISLNNAEK